jgi:amidase/6-aminohexanoate-cyclic-dimer hydrolase
MAFKEYGNYDAVGLADLVRKKQVTARELLDEAIMRTGKVDPQINAVVVKHYDYAQRQIDRGLADGPFTGVPFLLKDLEFLEGTRTTSGANIYRDHVADHTSTLAQRFLDAGLTIFGKSSTPEFGLMPTTESRLFGPTRNPWNLNTPLADLPGALAQPSPRASFPSRMPVTAAVRSASQPPRPACSD